MHQELRIRRKQSFKRLIAATAVFSFTVSGWAGVSTWVDAAQETSAQDANQPPATPTPAVATPENAPVEAAKPAEPAQSAENKPAAADQAPAKTSEIEPEVGEEKIHSPIEKKTPAELPQKGWVDAINSAKESLNAATFPVVNDARNNLDAAIQDFEAYLDQTPENKSNWLTFLKWPSLKEELAKQQPDQEALLQFEKRFRQNFNGLELAPFTRVRDALQRYIVAARFGTDGDKAVQILSNRLNKFADLVQTSDLFTDIDSRRDAAQTIAYLAQAQQAPSLVQQVQSSFARPNARVLVSAEYVQQRFGRGVCEPNPVCENILGTTIVGNSILSGSVSPKLVDNPNQATVRLNLFGDFSSNNIGYNRGVKLHTQGTATVFASETIALGDHGLYAMNDTSVNANLSTQINSIDAKLRIIEKIAAKTAAKQKPQADAIALGRMETKIRNQFHQQLSTQLVESNSKVGNPSFVEMARLGLNKPPRSSWSNSGYLALLWKIQNGVQLSAPTSCPHTVPTTGIALQFHESAVANLLDPVLAGRVLNSEESELYQQQFGELASGAARRDNGEPWAITMASFNPVEVQFEKGKIIFRIRTTKLDRGDQALEQPAHIAAVYNPVLENGALQLVREGDVKVDFFGRQQRGVRAVTLRTFLQKKFDDVFRRELLDEPLRVSDKLPPEMRDLDLVSVVSDGGWLQAHLD